MLPPVPAQATVLDLPSPPSLQYFRLPRHLHLNPRTQSHLQELGLLTDLFSWAKTRPGQQLCTPRFLAARAGRSRAFVGSVMAGAPGLHQKVIDRQTWLTVRAPNRQYLAIPVRALKALGAVGDGQTARERQERLERLGALYHLYFVADQHGQRHPDRQAWLISHLDLEDYLPIDARHHVTQILEALARRNLIELDGQAIWVRSPTALAPHASAPTAPPAAPTPQGNQHATLDKSTQRWGWWLTIPEDRRRQNVRTLPLVCAVVWLLENDHEVIEATHPARALEHRLARWHEGQPFPAHILAQVLADLERGPSTQQLAELHRIATRAGSWDPGHALARLSLDTPFSLKVEPQCDVAAVDGETLSTLLEIYDQTTKAIGHALQSSNNLEDAQELLRRGSHPSSWSELQQHTEALAHLRGQLHHDVIEVPTLVLEALLELYDTSGHPQATLRPKLEPEPEPADLDTPLLDVAPNRATGRTSTGGKKSAIGSASAGDINSASKKSLSVHSQQLIRRHGDLAQDPAGPSSVFRLSDGTTTMTFIEVEDGLTPLTWSNEAHDWHSRCFDPSTDSWDLSLLEELVTFAESWLPLLRYPEGNPICGVRPK